MLGQHSIARAQGISGSGRPLHAAVAPTQQRRRGARLLRWRAAGDGGAAPTTAQTAAAEAAAAPQPNGNGHASSSAGEAQPQQPRQQQQQSMRITATVVSSIDQVSRDEWDALAHADGEANPFVSWTFLHILEASGSATPETGWAPQHVLLRDDATGKLVGAAPAYLKSHSYGEYVFDQSWANFYMVRGGSYYPKLQCCVPFTPVTGPRLLAAPGPLRPAILKSLAEALAAVADARGASGAHVTFSGGDEWAALGAVGMLQRRGIQYHWENDGYSTFEDFLAALKQSRRKTIRQERRAVAKQGITVRRLSGAPGARGAPEPRHWARFYDFYLNTVDKRWGTAYLTRRFFEMLGAEMPKQVLLVAAEDAAGDMVAGALNLAGARCLYGRQWGADAARPEVKGLHFEACYYSAIEEAIARGLPRVEAGAQGEHKLQRGYLPAYTYSAHYLRDPTLAAAVGRFLDQEARQMTYTWQALTLEGSPFKKDKTLTYLMDKTAAFSSLSSSGGSMDG